MIHPFFSFWHDLACGSHGDCGVLILSTFLAFRFSSIMNNYHVVLYLFKNLEYFFAFLTLEVFLVIIMFFNMKAQPYLERFWTEDPKMIKSYLLFCILNPCIFKIGYNWN